MRTCFLAMFLSVLAAYPAQAQGDSLAWNAARPLTFADYTGGRPAMAGDRLAATTYTLYVMPYKAADGGLAWDVQALFSPSRSWVDPGSVNDVALLRHERLHFDLVEVHARELRRFLRNLPLRGTRGEAEKLKAIIAQRRALLDAEESVYDAETVHGTYRAEQLRWEQEVAARLRALAAYR